MVYLHKSYIIYKTEKHIIKEYIMSHSKQKAVNWQENNWAEILY